MMLQPIHQQTVLSPQYKQEYLPPLTADTSQIRKLIEQTYSKTVVLPTNHTVSAVNLVETPQGLVNQPISMDPQIYSKIVNIPAVNNSQNISQQPIIIKNNLSQSNNQPVITQSVNNKPINNNSSNIYRTPFVGYNPGKVRPTI